MPPATILRFDTKLLSMLLLLVVAGHAAANSAAIDDPQDGTVAVAAKHTGGYVLLSPLGSTEAQVSDRDLRSAGGDYRAPGPQDSCGPAGGSRHRSQG